MVEREHVTARDRTDGVPEAKASSDVQTNIRSVPSESAGHEAEADRQLKIGRAVQHDFREVLAALAK